MDDLVKRLRVYAEHDMLQGYIMGMFRPNLPSYRLADDLRAAAQRIEELEVARSQVMGASETLSEIGVEQAAESSTLRAALSALIEAGEPFLPLAERWEHCRPGERWPDDMSCSRDVGGPLRIGDLRALSAALTKAKEAMG